MNIKTFNTDYGKISLYKNDVYIIEPFNNNSYWDIDTLQLLKEYIDPNKNILEIGGHCGTSTIVYSSFLNNNNKVYVYEPQKNLYNLLLQNITQNNLGYKIIPHNKALFCDNIFLNMNENDLDGGGGIIEKRYNEENDKQCNFGGVCLGINGEKVESIIMDSIDYENIGFIHCDAQGAENYIFSKSTNFLKKHKPVILYENNKKYCKYLFNNVYNCYLKYKDFSDFDLEDYCLNVLNYSKVIHKFNGGCDDLLIP